jgi:hypothetical protein
MTKEPTAAPGTPAAARVEADQPDAGLEHDDDPEGDCADANITLTYRATVYVTIGDGNVRRVTVNDESLTLLADDGGECSGCCRILPAHHPAVTTAAAIAEDGDTEWHCWEIGQ